MLDIIPKIITEINASTIGFINVHSPEFYTKDGGTIGTPSVSVAERGGSESGYYRVLFTVLADDIGASKILALQLIILMENMLDQELKWQKVNGGLTDKLVKGKGETVFYMLFYEADSD